MNLWFGDVVSEPNGAAPNYVGEPRQFGPEPSIDGKGSHGGPAKVRKLGESPRNMVYLPYSQRFTPSLRDGVHGVSLSVSNSIP